MNSDILYPAELTQDINLTNFINKVVPGACIPNEIIARLENSNNPLEEGIAIAAEQVKQFSGIAQGVHLMAIKAEEKIPEILRKAVLSLQQQ